MVSTFGVSASLHIIRLQVFFTIFARFQTFFALFLHFGLYRSAHAVALLLSLTRPFLTREKAKFDCVPRAAGLIEPVSADSLLKTGIFAETAGDFRAIFTSCLAKREAGDQSECAKSRDFRLVPGSLGKPSRALECVAEVVGFELRRATRNQTLSPAREKWQNLFPPDLLSGFKRWNFENRTKCTESRASERNGHFGEQ